MLRPTRIAVYAGSGGYTLQAATEALAARALEGAIQAGLASGPWGMEGRILGLYQASAGDDAVYRRITGGWDASANPETGYAGLVYASESLAETVEIAERLADCLGAEAWGATRMGPRRLAAGIIEAVGDFDPDAALDCARRALGRPRPTRPPEMPLERLSKPYMHPSWRLYPGALVMPRRGERARGPWRVRVGVSLVEGRFIADARIDGVFLAAPPSEPFSTIAGITGMPAGDQVLLAVEARFSAAIELHGIEPVDVVEALRDALGV